MCTAYNIYFYFLETRFPIVESMELGVLSWTSKNWGKFLESEAEICGICIVTFFSGKETQWLSTIMKGSYRER